MPALQLEVVRAVVPVEGGVAEAEAEARCRQSIPRSS